MQSSSNATPIPLSTTATTVPTASPTTMETKSAVSPVTSRRMPGAFHPNTSASRYGQPPAITDLNRSHDPSAIACGRVRKRNGQFEETSLSKIEQRIKVMSRGLYVDPIKLAKQVMDSTYDGISTKEIDVLAASYAHEKITDHPDWDVLAARLAVSNHQKETIAPFSEVMRILYDAGQIADDFMRVVEANADTLDRAIDYDRDNLLTYFGFRTFEHSYSLTLQETDTITKKQVNKCYERPQHMYMRVALALHLDDIEAAIESYEWMSCQYFTHASPTLMNAGKRKAQLSSCFLVAMKEEQGDEHPDSIPGIYQTLMNIARISASSGGIGLHIGIVRAEGSPITSAGRPSSGIVPMLLPFEATAKYVDQGRKRKGAIAVYMEPWHADIEDFLKIKDNTSESKEWNESGKTRMRDLHIALWIPDVFMQRVEEDGVWSLMCPFFSPDLVELYGQAFTDRYVWYESQGAPYVRRTVRARQIWTAIIDAQIHTGEPYMLYKDAVNRKTNHQNLGTIKSSNLCVAPYTKVLTRQHGYIAIGELKDQATDVWNGFEWSEVTIRQTGQNKQLVRVTLSNGSVLDCTPEHKFYVNLKFYACSDKTALKDETATKVVCAGELQVGDKLIKHDLPQSDDIKFNTPFPYAYTHGFYCGDGCEFIGQNEQCSYVARQDTAYCERHAYFRDTKFVTSTSFDLYRANGVSLRCQAPTHYTPHIALYGEKSKLEPFLEHRNAYDNGSKRVLQLNPDMPQKFTVPLTAPLETKMQWLSGLFDADGTVAKNGTNESLQLGSINHGFLTNVMLMLQTHNVHSKVTLSRSERETMMPDGKGGEKEYHCKAIYRLLINSINTQLLIKLGFAPRRLKINTTHVPDRDSARFITVKSVEPLDGVFDTYCFTEPKLGLGTFEGITTGNCAEIVQYSSSEKTATCNLASISLKAFVVIQEDGTRTYDFETLAYVVRMVARNLERIIDINHYPVIEAKTSNLSERPMGIGVQALADAFIAMRFPFDSPEAAKLNREIFETIYYAAVDASCEMAEEIGVYETYEGSPVSQGLLQFDMWLKEGREVQLSGRWDWAALKQRIAKHGVRNSLLVALMPTASTSQMLANNESIECYTENMYVRNVLSGSFKIVNRQMILDLINAGLWTTQMKNKIIGAAGSIQSFTEIPQNIRDLYKTAWEIKQRVMLDQAADRAPFVDQTASQNCFMAQPSMAALTSYHMYGWKKGLKTGLYYLRSKPAQEAVQVTVDPTAQSETTPATTEDAPEATTNEEGWVCKREEGCTTCSA